MDDAARLRAATDALAHWPLQASAINEVSRSENIVFRVDCGTDASYVLRLHRPGYHSLDELISEQLWTKALRDADLDVPVPLLTHDGHGYARIQLGGQTRFAGMLEWVDGAPLYDLIESSDAPAAAADWFNQLGMLMAAMHNQATAWQPPTGFVRHALDADGLMGSSPFWGRFWESPVLTPAERTQFTDMRARLYDTLRSYGTDPATYSLIHADLHPGNIIAHDGALHVIDFDDAGFGWHAYDLAVALKNYTGREDFTALEDALIAGYRQVRHLDDDTIGLIPLFLLIRALATIGWVAGRPDLGHIEYARRLIQYVHDHTDDAKPITRRRSQPS